MIEKSFRNKGPSILLCDFLRDAVLLATALVLLTLGPVLAQTSSEATNRNEPGAKVGAVTSLPESQAETNMTLDQRIVHIEDMLNSMKPMIETLRRAEERTYFTKLLSYELVGYLKVMVVALVAIAFVFPLTIWWMSRKRILGLSSLSDEVSATLVIVEERQAKLATILKDVQSEIDYVQSMSVPDLKNLIAQAEKYLKQNATDLEKAGTPKTKPGRNDADPARTRTN
jgi:hypothetical protein